MRYSANIIKTGFILFLALQSFQLTLSGTDTDMSRFANRRLQELHERMPVQALPGNDTIMPLPSVTNDKEIVFTFNRKGQLSHLGVSLFSYEIKHMVDTDICNFIERFFLDLLLQPDNGRVNGKLDEFNITLTLNGQDFGKGMFNSIPDVLRIIGPSADFTLRDRGKTADAVWNFSGNTLKMTFPLYRELIKGTDKKESDMELYDILLSAVSDTDCHHMASDKPEKVIPTSDGLYVSKGETGLLPSLSSDRHYTLKRGEYEPVFDTKFPIKSMNNLFLTFRHGLDKTLQITHRQYGHLTPVITIPVHNFLACFHESHQVTCFTGYNKNGELETTVVLKHNTLDYIHILRARIAEEDLFKPSPVLKADFYSNIPQHYIKTLLQ